MRPIDGDKLIGVFYDLCSKQNDPTVMLGLGYISAFIESKEVAITLDELRPKGRWNIVEIDKDSRRITIECSECGMVEEVSLTAYGLGHNFCHSCGADMR